MPASKKKKPKKKGELETQDEEKKEEIMVMSMEEIEMLSEKMTRQVSLLQKSRSNFKDGGSKLPRNLLLSVEAQQISNTLHSFITNIEIAVTRVSFMHLDTVPSVDDKDLMALLDSHQTVAERLEAQDGFKGYSGVEIFEGYGEGDGIRLERDFMDSIRNIFKCFQANPEAIFGLKTKICTGQEGLFLAGLRKFHKQMNERLKNSPDEELQFLLRKQAPSCTLKAMEDIVKLESEMTDIIKKVDSQIYEKNDEIKLLDSRLQDDGKKDMGLPPPSDEHCQTCIKTSEVKQAGTKKENDGLTVQLNKLIAENKKTIKELQENIERKEVEIEEFLNDFDERMEENQAELEKCEKQYQNEEEELGMLAEPFAVLEVEYNMIMERKRQLEDKRQAELKELERKTKAALLIQAYWRDYRARHAAKNPKQKGKGKGKGKGKKGKK